MFSVGWPELTIVLIVGLMVVGPKDLPKALRQVGKWVGAARRMSREFHRHVDDMVREAELDELKEGVDTLRRTTSVRGAIENTIDPDRSLRKTLNNPLADTAEREKPGAEGPAAGPAAAKQANGKVDETGGAAANRLATPSAPAETPAESAKAAKKSAATKKPATPKRATKTTASDKPAARKTAKPKTSARSSRAKTAASGATATGGAPAASGTAQTPAASAPAGTPAAAAAEAPGDS